ncbi:MAG: FHA domain-containing protein [Planctomycetota bacterium]|jgi:anti-sigma regulatory factor (Ser/Thr protein kinase)
MAQVKVLVAERIVEAHPLSEDSTIGRSPASTVLIPDESVSREHAVIRHQMGAWFIEDLGSANGIEVDGRTVGGAQLQEGSVVRIGDVELTFTLEEAPAPAERIFEVRGAADLDEGAEWEGLEDFAWRVPSDRDTVDAVSAAVQRLLTDSCLSPTEELRFHLSAQEAIGNAMRHGNGGDPTKQLMIRMMRSAKRVLLRVTDEGPGFDFREALRSAREDDPVTVARARYAQGRCGGLGVMMMVRGCDVVEFSRGGAELTLMKCPGRVLERATVAVKRPASA